MKFNTNKEKGNTALGMAITYFTAQGYVVSIPLNDTQDYDLIIDLNGEFKSIQVKGNGCKTKYDSYQVSLKSCGGTAGRTYKTLINTDITYDEDRCKLLSKKAQENIDEITLPKLIRNL